MFRRSHFHLRLFVTLLGVIAVLLTASAQHDAIKRGRKYKSPPPSSRIAVTILRDLDGKPIENAAVVFHPMEGEKNEGNMELKTDGDGKTVIDVLPIGGKVRLQVIAKGFQTFGDDYDNDQAEQTIEIRMKRPGEQYSIYKKHDNKPVGGKTAGDAVKTDPAKDAAPTSQTK
jgi:hypothetical protein